MFENLIQSRLVLVSALRALDVVNVITHITAPEFD